ncbi:hypothetical protein [Flavobacterium sp. GT3P67]|uniref:hypothetical protein n=1 Tax=Flavobacterium sp. GT3P67 TaxID=2541722 RepID=UPI0010454483|nr:hypothetical protein [Flavobacterium sp. GT3P67]TDE51330.1 hypothetical protein E0H99_12045 [Flavobacterium sp. GT3P67]
MKKLVLFYLLINSGFAFGQETYESVYVPVSTLERTYEGTIYLFPNWEGKFEIYDSDNKGFSLANLNYNVLTKMIESKFTKDSIFRFEAKKINFIKYASKRYRFYDIRESLELFQELYISDNVRFLKGFNVTYKEGYINPLTQAYIQKEKCYIVEKYFLKLNNKNFIELKLNKHSILKQLGDKASQIKKYASISKLRFKSERDLFMIFQYYDTL